MLSASDRARLVADVSTAGSIAAPYWPLTTFVAVNPLGGLTDLPFGDTARPPLRRWFGARTHLPLEAYRAEHARGTVTDADLDRAILRHDPSLADRGPLDLGASASSTRSTSSVGTCCTARSPGRSRRGGAEPWRTRSTRS